MINETFMRLDDWSLQLDPNTPLSVRKECRKYDQIVITESRIDGDLDRDTLTRAALFRGPILKRADRMTSLGGAGMEWFLGNAAGIGPTVGWSFVADRSLANWFSRITTDTAWGGLTVATGIDLPTAVRYPDAAATEDGFADTQLFPARKVYVTREVLNVLAGAFPFEWDITPDGTFQATGAGSGNYWQGGTAGTAPTMSTPLVILMRGQEGRDIDLIGLEVIDIDREEDAASAGQGVLLYGLNGGSAPVATGDTDRLTYDAVGVPKSADLVVTNSGLTTTADVDAAGDSALSETAPTNNYRATVRDWYPGRWVKPGDYVWAFDDVCEIYADTDTGILYRGEWVAADTVRCYGMRWAIREGMGVYRLTRGDPATYETTRTEVLDITDYVIPEDGDCELVIGSPEQSVADILGLS